MQIVLMKITKGKLKAVINPSDTHEDSMTETEEAVLPYIAEFILRQLHSRLRSNKNPILTEAAEMFQDASALEGDDSHSLLAYTRTWTEARANRGDLHHVTDKMFLLFRCMEIFSERHIFLVFK